jgi:hypothetical protein
MNQQTLAMAAVLALVTACQKRTAAEQPQAPTAAPSPMAKADGYRGIWFTLGQFSEHGDKYSGGLGTYTANHTPIAVYAPQVNQTFFVYGGTRKNQKHLLIMASSFDHAKNRVPQPTIVHDKQGVDDPHDNASITIDDQGHLWIFVSGRGRSRPGFKYRSTQPYNIDHFELIEQAELTYPQPHAFAGEGFLHLFTKYTKGRELYWENSRDGRSWQPAEKLAGFGGHYQVSERSGDKVGTSFMWHPDGNVDKRTNLYYLQTTDRGRTWTTVDGQIVQTPLATKDNEALLIDYHQQGLNVYIHDLNFDQDGNPVILYLTSKGAQPGPQNDPRTWRVTHWDGDAWQTHDVADSDHNYDTGSLYVDGERWMVIGPTQPGPQPYGTGGEVAIWVSQNRGQDWRLQRQVTRNSQYNHSYVRRPRGAHDPFFAFWADGDPSKLSESRLYFTNAAGDRYWQLPYDMHEAYAEPVEMAGP